MAGKKKKKKKQKQAEMKGKGFSVDAVGASAKKYLQARDETVKAKEALEVAASRLVKMLREKKRKTIRVAGVTITLGHKEAQDLLKISKPKEK